MRAYCLLLCCCLAAVPSFCGEDDDKKSPEEKLAEEARGLMSGDKRESIRGLFQLMPESQDDKPFPKVVGILSQKGVVYQIMIIEKEIRERLKIHDKTEITLLGRILNKGDQGAYFITDEVYQQNALGPKAKKKRGGL
jgi:hypothetical protein